MVHSRPLSKHKKWVVTEILKKERVYDHDNVGRRKHALQDDGGAQTSGIDHGKSENATRGDDDESDPTRLGAAPRVIGVPSASTTPWGHDDAA
jgi:hypothetical protein